MQIQDSILNLHKIYHPITPRASSASSPAPNPLPPPSSKPSWSGEAEPTGNAPLSYRRQVVFHAPTGWISYTGFARVISLLVTSKHACGDVFLPIMCKICPTLLPIMCKFYSKFLPIMWLMVCTLFIINELLLLWIFCSIWTLFECWLSTLVPSSRSQIETLPVTMRGVTGELFICVYCNDCPILRTLALGFFLLLLHQ